ncbi:alpha/beta hydrolase family protein [Paraglaciecola arctica]|uniref:alpha/beta hydrolase family protein n=1 Tax=Paraglaciecola arctica TaxID=1128911 RepID=UPI001C071CF2|nr:alpha/beta hydrolase [Paraglaciecola arctica]MBU3004473.1 alpha/beta hydrolase [Paraglaciecola arctica]
MNTGKKTVNSQSVGQLQKLPTKAGHSVAITVFRTEIEAVKGVCIIAAATGVAQRLYRDFAIWLTTQGYHAVTFDYDGIGLSIDGHVKHCKSDVLSWASNDCPAVLEAVEQQFSGLECIWIGHSVGGHMLGMMPDTKQISRAINVAVGTGTWWYNSPSTKRVSWFLWYVLVPATVPLLGYFPGDKLKVMCNLPKGVMMQWRRWCLKDGYAVEGEGQWLKDRFASVNFPITAIAFSDDDMMSLKNIDMLHEQFIGADVTRHVVEPKGVGLKRIGHIGWHKAHCQSLWEQVISPVLSD